MGEEAKQVQEEAPNKAEEAAPPPQAAAAAEEKKKSEEEKTEEKKEEEAPRPPSSLVLSVELHCAGCAKKIERSLLRVRGVERVVVDMDRNQVTIKGVVEPQAVCNKILEKTRKSPKILSPQPAAEGQPIPEIVSSQVTGLTTLELTINMHCEPCALQLKKKILQMRGVQTVETELSSGKVTVTGTIDGDKLVDYIYRRTKKQAKIVPPPEPEPQPEPQPEPEPEPENKPEEKKQEETPPEEPKPAEEKKEAEAPPPPPPPEEPKKEEPAALQGENIHNVNPMMICHDEESMRRMTSYYQPLYVIDRIPPAPQLFSDENPNACCIS